MINQQLCKKKDATGKECSREKGHDGACINVQKRPDGFANITTFIPGWLDQGDKPARRKFITWIICFAIMVSMSTYIAMFFNWLGFVMLLLLGLALGVAGKAEIVKMYKNYKEESKRK